jgi:hypothetical protein
MEKHWLFGEVRKKKFVERKYFEEDINTAIDHALELIRLCRYWSMVISEVLQPILPTSAYLAEVRSGLEEMANWLDRKIDWLKKVRSEAYRLEEV